MATNAWAGDLDKLKRELTTKIDRLTTDLSNATRSAGRGADPAELARRLEALERRVQTTIDQTNRTFTSAHSSDERMEARLTAVERRLQTTIDQTNRTFTSAHSEDDRINTRLSQLESRLDRMGRS